MIGKERKHKFRMKILVTWEIDRLFSKYRRCLLEKSLKLNIKLKMRINQNGLNLNRIGWWSSENMRILFDHFYWKLASIYCSNYSAVFLSFCDTINIFWIKSTTKSNNLLYSGFIYSTGNGYLYNPVIIARDPSHSNGCFRYNIRYPIQPTIHMSVFASITSVKPYISTNSGAL